MKEIINTQNAPAPVGPYSQAIKAGNFLFISGQIAIDPKTGQLINGSIQEHTKMIFSNIGEILKEADMGFSDIVKVSVFIKDMNNFSPVNEIYKTFFTENPPARSFVEVSRLPKDVPIEIEVIAYRKLGSVIQN